VRLSPASSVALARSAFACALLSAIAWSACASAPTASRVPSRTLDELIRASLVAVRYASTELVVIHSQLAKGPTIRRIPVPGRLLVEIDHFADALLSDVAARLEGPVRRIAEPRFVPGARQLSRTYGTEGAITLEIRPSLAPPISFLPRLPSAHRVHVGALIELEIVDLRSGKAVLRSICRPSDSESLSIDTLLEDEGALAAERFAVAVSACPVELLRALPPARSP